MQITAGKFYKTRDGRKVGPMERASGLTEWPWCADEWDDYCRDNGTVSPMGKNYEMPGDLIEEWTEPTATPAPAGPVRMVRRIVPGVYGRIEIVQVWSNEVAIRIVGREDGKASNHHTYLINAEEWRSLCMVGSQLAEALDDQP